MFEMSRRSRRYRWPKPVHVLQPRPVRAQQHNVRSLPGVHLRAGAGSRRLPRVPARVFNRRTVRRDHMYDLRSRHQDLRLGVRVHHLPHWPLQRLGCVHLHHLRSGQVRQRYGQCCMREMPGAFVLVAGVHNMRALPARLLFGPVRRLPGAPDGKRVQVRRRKHVHRPGDRQRLLADF